MKPETEESQKLVIEIVATVENPGNVNPSISIHEAIRALSGMNGVVLNAIDRQTNAASPRVKCEAKWSYEEKLTD